MREKILYGLWACLYVLCVGLGTLSPVSEAGSWVLTAVGVVFFLPGVLLLIDAIRENSRSGLIRLRVICITSLMLTAVVFACNIAGAQASQQARQLLHDLLQLVSAPMLCCRFWALSLFLWACLLMGSFPKLWLPSSSKKKK